MADPARPDKVAAAKAGSSDENDAAKQKKLQVTEHIEYSMNR